MLFFDLNIAFSVGREGKCFAEKKSMRDERLKVAMKALELGYTGVAYNRRIDGVFSDLDKCSIDLFPISKLLKMVPGYFSNSVKFHRELLGVPVNSPFRQYTRVTVEVQSSFQAGSLKAGNPVLRTYDLVAVRPMTQVVFNQACQDLEVDLISLDFNQMLPFPLTLLMVEAAIKRGIYFEVSYSPFISNDQARMHMLQGVKLLVAWTHGKNLIFTSAASNVNGIRGPNDVANFSTLFGVSIEFAKAAVSKNCRSLIANALRRKQCYKESFEVERLPPYKSLGFENSWLDDWHLCDHSKKNYNLPLEGVLAKKEEWGREELVATEDPIGHDIVLVADAMLLEEVVSKTEEQEQGTDVPMEEVFLGKEEKKLGEVNGLAIEMASIANDMPLEGALPKVEKKQGEDMVSVAVMPLEQVLVGNEEHEHTNDLVPNDGPTIHMPKSDDMPLKESLAKTRRKQGGDLVPIADIMPIEGVLDGKEELKKTKDPVAVDFSTIDIPIADVMSLEEVTVEKEELKQTTDLAAIDGSTIHMPRSGKHRSKRKSLARTYPLPFRGILKSLLFKRKPRKILRWKSLLQ